MTTKTTSTFESAGRYSAEQPANIAVKTWAPAEPRAILQLNHGMVEYIDRYDAFATTLAERGWLVVGMDFIGHGDSAPEPDQLGFTGLPLDGPRNVFIEDMHSLRRRVAAEYPDLPYFMFGHSMGSFVLRAYLAQHGAGLAGAVISGTGVMASAMIVGAKVVLGVLGVFHGPEYRSPFFNAMSLGPYNKPFAKGGRTEFDWLSRDPGLVDAYIADARCGGLFTLAANRCLIDAAARANAVSTYADTPKDLPLLLISGAADPVGGMRAGVKAVAENYRKAGANATLRLYDDARHELLNELNKEEVTEDLIAWLEALC